MLLNRSKQSARDLPLPMVRAFSAVSLLSYPAGALTLAIHPDKTAVTFAGYALVLIAVLSYIPLNGSSIQRIVGEDVKELDDMELRLRGRALSRSYAAFTWLILLAVLYAGNASAIGGWVPRSFEEYSGVFFGIVLHAAVLPIAILSWIIQQPLRSGANVTLEGCSPSIDTEGPGYILGMLGVTLITIAVLLAF